jgi:hypothetical protein
MWFADQETREDLEFMISRSRIEPYLENGYSSFFQKKVYGKQFSKESM